jgi:WD40 repeat protein
LRFSNGGQFLAAAYPRQKNTAQKSSVHLINIYNSYTLEEVGRLNDHSALITDICWKSDDRAVYSVGADGTTTEWKQGDPKAENKDWQGKKWTQANSKYSSVIYEKSAHSVLTAGL